jgi:hypothetical protein
VLVKMHCVGSCKPIGNLELRPILLARDLELENGVAIARLSDGFRYRDFLLGIIAGRSAVPHHGVDVAIAVAGEAGA